MRRAKGVRTIRPIEDAIGHVRIHLNGVLSAQRDRLESDGSFQKDLLRIRSLRVEHTYALLAAESIEDLPAEASYETDRDDNNIEDLYRVAIRKLPEGVAQPGSTTEVVHESGSEHANTLLTWENTASDSRFSSRQKGTRAMRVASRGCLSVWMKNDCH